MSLDRPCKYSWFNLVTLSLVENKKSRSRKDFSIPASAWYLFGYLMCLRGFESLQMAVVSFKNVTP